MNGKQFEALIKLACEEQGIDFTRLRDAGWRGESTERRFTISNICDCILFRKPFIYFVEIKKMNKSLRFDEITQLDELKKKYNPIGGIHSGVICRLDDVCFWLKTSTILLMQNEINKKSFNKSDAEQYGILIPMIKPRGKRKERPDLFFI